MKLYLSIKKMTFKEDNIEHNIINGILNKEYLGYDEIVEIPDDDKFIKDTMRIIYKKDNKREDTDEIDYKVFDIREKNTWWGFPLYELKDGKIVSFDYSQYVYFAGTDRRNILAGIINELYNPSSELKILRKTLKYIMDELNLSYPDYFDIMYAKIENIIQRNPKDIIK